MPDYIAPISAFLEEYQREAKVLADHLKLHVVEKPAIAKRAGFRKTLKEAGAPSKRRKKFEESSEPRYDWRPIATQLQVDNDVYSFKRCDIRPPNYSNQNVFEFPKMGSTVEKVLFNEDLEALLKLSSLSNEAARLNAAKVLTVLQNRLSTNVAERLASLLSKCSYVPNQVYQSIIDSETIVITHVLVEGYNFDRENRKFLPSVEDDSGAIIRLGKFVISTHLTDVSELDMENLFNPIPSKNQSEFETLFQQRVCSTMEQRRDFLVDKISQLTNQLLQLKTSLGFIEFSLNAARTSSEVLIKKTIEKVDSIPGIEEVRFHKKGVSVFTKDIFGEDSQERYPGKKYFGKYAVNVIFEKESFSVMVKNLEAPKKYLTRNEQLYHPHTTFGNGVCMGGYGTILQAAAQSIDLEKIVRTTLEFLQTFNSNDSAGLSNWKALPVDKPDKEDCVCQPGWTKLVGPDMDDDMVGFYYFGRLPDPNAQLAEESIRTIREEAAAPNSSFDDDVDEDDDYPRPAARTAR